MDSPTPETQTGTVRILLVEDEPLWQQGVDILLSSDPRFDLLEPAEDYETALARFAEIRPDIVLLDWKIKGEQDGLAVGEALLSQGIPPERIVLISGSDPSSIPAHPYLFVPKHRMASELLPLLQSLL